MGGPPPPPSPRVGASKIKGSDKANRAKRGSAKSSPNVTASTVADRGQWAAGHDAPFELRARDGVRV